MDTSDPRYAAARKQVDEEKGFYSHATSYIVVNGFLFALDFFTSPGHWWFYWPLLGWGIGLASHGFQVFGRQRLFSSRWEDRRIKELMDKDRPE